MRLFNLNDKQIQICLALSAAMIADECIYYSTYCGYLVPYIDTILNYMMTLLLLRR